MDKYVKRLEKAQKNAQKMYSGAKNVAKFVKKADKMLPTVESDDNSEVSSDEEEKKVPKKRKAGKKSRKDQVG